MAVFDRIRGWFNRAPSQKESGRTMFRLMTDAGVPVDHDSALTMSAVWACVRVVSQTLGVLNMHVYQSTPGGGKRRREDLRVDQMLRRRPNDQMTAMTFKEVMTAHMLTWGNGYAEIERDLAGRPVNLWPLLPDRTRPVLAENGDVYYEHSIFQGGDRYYLPGKDVFHLKGFGFDGLQGYDVIAYASRSIGAGIAAETFGSSYFGNGTHLSGGLFHPKRLSKEARQGIREEFEKAYQGPRKAFRMGVFEEGVDWKPFGLSPEASQFIETRQFSVEEVARWFGVPLHKIGHLLRSTNNNIEHQGIEYVVDTVLPIAVRWEQEADAKLLTTGLRNDHYCKLNVATLMRGDMKSRYDAYKIGREWGWLNANQICELEDLDPIGEIGDVYLVPLNFQNAEALLDPPEPPAPQPSAAPSETSEEPEDAEDDPAPAAAPKRAARVALADAAGRGLRRFRHAWAEGAKRVSITDDVVPTMAAKFAGDLEPPAAVMWALLGGEQKTLAPVLNSVAATVIEDFRARLEANDLTFLEPAGLDRIVDRVVDALVMLRSAQ